jgi:hypothetical protein
MTPMQVGIHQTLGKDMPEPVSVAPAKAAWSNQAIRSQKYSPSEPQFKVKVSNHIWARMPDGVDLAVVVTRPDAEGKFPAIMSYNPYHALTKKHPLPDPAYFAERGYAVVQYDVRGTGNSGGSTKDMYADPERKDGYDMIEWIANQPWCNGNVGMWGISYGGVDTWQTAMQQPPHLKAIIVRSGTEDVYTEWTYPGGVLRPLMFDSYVPSMTAQNFAPPDIDLAGEKWDEIWKEHLENNVPWGMGFIEHQFDGSYWRARSLRPDYDRIKCPAFLIEGWPDWYATPLLRAFTHLQVPKRILIGPWGHYWPEDPKALPGPRIDGRPEYLRWWDQWLKGIDTALAKEPPVTIFVREYKPPAEMYLEDKGFWRRETDWPLARTQYTTLYLNSEAKLEREAPRAERDGHDEYAYNPAVGVAAGRQVYTPWAQPLDQRPDEAYSLTYTGSPLEKDMEVTGNPTAVIYVSSTADVAYFTVKVCDVASDGTSKLVTFGALNATHRASDASPEPLKAGEVYELKIPLRSMAYIFPAGHRIRVDIASADFQNAWPTGKNATNTVYRSAAYPSRVILPVAPPQDPKLPTPDFRPAPYPMPAADELKKPTHKVINDLVNEFAGYTLTSEGSTSEFRVSTKDPAVTVDKGTHEYTAVDLPGLKIQVFAQTVLSSDATSFRYLEEVEVTVNGVRHFHKSWTRLVPRQLN